MNGVEPVPKRYEIRLRGDHTGHDWLNALLGRYPYAVYELGNMEYLVGEESTRRAALRRIAHNREGRAFYIERDGKPELPDLRSVEDAPTAN